MKGATKLPSGDLSIYLGDGVYLTKMKWDYTLTTGSHLVSEAANVIYLEPEVLQNLLNIFKEEKCD